MNKTLLSGIIVEDSQYYQLLEWKDNNQKKFEFFCKEYNIKHMSINQMNKEDYNSLIDFANI